MRFACEMVGDTDISPSSTKTDMINFNRLQNTVTWAYTWVTVKYNDFEIKNSVRFCFLQTWLFHVIQYHRHLTTENI
jgi:hypothetical protein